MADSSPTVGELFKDKTVTDENVSALVESVLAGKLDDRAELAEGYVLDVAAAVNANPFADSVLRDRTSMLGSKRSAARTEIVMVGAQKMRPNRLKSFIIRSVARTH